MKMFSQNCSKEILEERNSLIMIMEIIIVLINLIFDIPLIIRLIFNYNYGFYPLKEINPPQIENIIFAIIFFIIGTRFEFWSVNYWADKYPKDGGDWVKYHRENDSVNQSKFFTFKTHKKGDLNPFW